MIKRRIEQKLKIFFVKSFKHLIPYCPRKLLYLMVNLSVSLTYKSGDEKINALKQQARRLLGEGTPDKKIDLIVRRSLINTRKDLFETWMFPALTRAKIRKFADFAGRENLDAALAEKKGVIILLAHFGFRKLILAALGYEGYKVNQIAARPTNWKLNKNEAAAHNQIMDMEAICEKSIPCNFIYTDESLKPIFKALNNNEIVVTAIDGLVGGKRIGVRFFDYTANFSPSAMLLAMKTKSTILPAFVVRQPDNRHKIVIEKPLILKEDLEKNNGVNEGINEFRDILGKYVLENPCHYVDWLYRTTLWPIGDNLFVFQ